MADVRFNCACVGPSQLPFDRSMWCSRSFVLQVLYKSSYCQLFFLIGSFDVVADYCGLWCQLSVNCNKKFFECRRGADLTKIVTRMFNIV
jgi:hypothetical protein